MICGRCGGDLYDAGSEEGLDWYVCEVCDFTEAEHDPIFNYDIELRQVQSKPRLFHPKKNRKWFNP